MRRHTEHGTWSREKNLLERLPPDIYIELRSTDEFLVTLTKVKSGFLVTDLSQLFEIHFVIIAIKFFIHK